MKSQKSIISETVKVVDDTAESVAKVLDTTEKTIERTVAPARKHVLKRFPTLFLLLVAFAFTATVTGMEHLLLQIDYFASNPGVLFIIGLVLLIITGSLYKKLS